jgi:hypothetical protein
MKRIDAPQIKALQWYLDFLSDDFERMSNLEFSKRVIEAQHYFTDHIPSLSSAMPGKGESISPRFPSGDSLTHDRSAMWPITYDWRANLKTIQIELKEVLQEIMAHPDVTIGIARVDLVAGQDYDGNIRLRYFHWYPQEVSEPERSRILAKVGFSVSLDRIPLEAIRVCKQCGRYFVHVSKKVRDFCTSKCTSRAMSKRRRDADPEKYRAVQREIMRKKYRVLKARQTGVPVGKIRIQRKSRSKRFGKTESEKI